MASSYATRTPRHHLFSDSAVSYILEINYAFMKFDINYVDAVCDYESKYIFVFYVKLIYLNEL